jgi:hypothetical protein
MSQTVNCSFRRNGGEWSPRKSGVGIDGVNVGWSRRIAVEMIEGLRYKLCMMGIEVTGPTAMFCDNESVVKNSTRPEST